MTQFYQKNHYHLYKTKMKTFTIKETKEKTSEILDEMRLLFKVWSYKDDSELDKTFPAPKKLTTRHFQYSIEPDAETLGKSAQEGDPEMKGITLRERLLMEIQYFKETGQHLDIKGVTLCSGSRCSGGSVPGVCWGAADAEVGVRACSVDGSSPAGGLRTAVSLSSTSPTSITLDSDLEQAIELVKKEGFVIYKPI